MEIKTEDLSIRRIALEDWNRIKEIWEDQKCSVYARFDRPCDTNPYAVRKRIEQWASYKGSYEHMFFAVCLAEKIIGYVALNRRDLGYEIGYCFHSAYQGKGYAKKSIQALIWVIYEYMPDAVITAGTAIENLPSVRLLQSLGFNKIGTEKVSFYKDSEGNPIYFEGGIFRLNVRDYITGKNQKK